MRIWWVIGYDNYYPNSDNFLASFCTEQEAYVFVKEQHRRYNHYDVINIQDRL